MVVRIIGRGPGPDTHAPAVLADAEVRGGPKPRKKPLKSEPRPGRKAFNGK